MWTRIDSPRPVLVVRCDNNYASHRSVVAAYCVAHNIPLGIVGLTTSTNTTKTGVGATAQLTAADKQYLASLSGTEIWSHSYSHPCLSNIVEAGQTRPFHDYPGIRVLATPVADQAARLALSWVDPPTATYPGDIAYQIDNTTHYEFTGTVYSNNAHWTALSAEDAVTKLQSALDREFVESKADIEAIIGQTVKGMIYPGHLIKNDGIEAALAAGYDRGGTIAIGALDKTNAMTAFSAYPQWSVPQNAGYLGRFRMPLAANAVWGDDWDTVVKADLDSTITLCKWGHLIFHYCDAESNAGGTSCTAARFAEIMDYLIAAGAVFVTHEQLLEMMSSTKHPTLGAPVDDALIYTTGYNLAFDGHMRFTTTTGGKEHPRSGYFVTGKALGWSAPDFATTGFVYSPPTTEGAPLSLVDGAACGYLAVDDFTSYTAWANHVHLPMCGDTVDGKYAVLIKFQARLASGAAASNVKAHIRALGDGSSGYLDGKYLAGSSEFTTASLGALSAEWQTFSTTITVGAGAILAIGPTPVADSRMEVTDLQVYKVLPA